MQTQYGDDPVMHIAYPSGKAPYFRLQEQAGWQHLWLILGLKSFDENKNWFTSDNSDL